jgi:phage N-6-adenine-methyltransferase
MTKSLVRTSSRIPQKYDPSKGLKSIAVAEAAERHYKRVKDLKMLGAAVEAKLTEQRNFVLWWDGAGPGTKHGGKQNRGSGILPGMPDPKTVHRWRTKLKDEAAFADAVRVALDRCAAICAFAGQAGAHVGQNTGEFEWYTPESIIESARTVLGAIDLDPASHDEAQKIVKAAAYYTAEDDGLSKGWNGRVWMNPPYSQPLIGQFCDKLCAEILASRIKAAITLTNNATETQWGQSLLQAAAGVCFPDGRIRFWSLKNKAAPLQGQMICYFGFDADKFCAEFCKVGSVLSGR